MGQFAAMLKDTKGGIGKLMEVYSPRLNGTVVIIEVISDTQKTQFDTIAVGLRNFLYSQTGTQVELQIAVNKTTDGSPKYFSPQDKMKRLLEINPALRRLQVELGLDADYD